MTVFKTDRQDRWQLSSSPMTHAKHIDGGKVQVSIATTLTDFMQATPFLRRVAMETYAPISPNGIGTLLARMNHCGSSRESGYLVLARIDGALVGFAVLLAPDDDTLELAWLHAGDTDSDLVFDNLWDEVVRIKTEWQIPILQVGIFAPMPRDVGANASSC